MTYLGLATQVPAPLKVLLFKEFEEMKIAAFAISRTGSHYFKKDRIKLFFDEDFDFNQVV